MAYPALLNLIVQIVYLFFQQQDLSECDTQSIGSLLIFAQKQCCKTAMQIGANLKKRCQLACALCCVVWRSGGLFKLLVINGCLSFCFMVYIKTIVFVF